MCATDLGGNGGGADSLGCPFFDLLLSLLLGCGLTLFGLIRLPLFGGGCLLGISLLGLLLFLLLYAATSLVLSLSLRLLLFGRCCPVGSLSLTSLFCFSLAMMTPSASMCPVTWVKDYGDTQHGYLMS